MLTPALVAREVARVHQACVGRVASQGDAHEFATLPESQIRVHVLHRTHHLAEERQAASWRGGDVLWVSLRETRSVAEKKERLVCLDYGKGGVWAFVLAESEGEIRRRLPALTIVYERPPWLDNDKEARIRERMTVDIDDTSHSFIIAASADPEPSLPRIVVDFLKPRDDQGRLTLTHVGARRDLAELETEPYDGMRVVGQDEEVLVEGTLRFNQERNW